MGNRPSATRHSIAIRRHHPEVTSSPNRPSANQSGQSTTSSSPANQTGPSTRMVSPTKDSEPLIRRSSSESYTVFISHAVEDKETIAIPLREMLRLHGVSAFVDESDLHPSMETENVLTSAMESAKVAVIVLSPETIARKWPMRELMHFLRRRNESNESEYPVIIPFFYRLSVSELHEEPRLDRVGVDGTSLYGTSRFLERMKAGQPEANIAAIKQALRKVIEIMGVTNYVEASNDNTSLMSRRRTILLRELCDDIRKAVQWETKSSEKVVYQSETDNSFIATQGVGGVGMTSALYRISSSPRVSIRVRDGEYQLSPSENYTVFISHAGEDKETIAIPLREMLRQQGVSAFVDKSDLHPCIESENVLTSAMESAKVAVIVLSPETIARKWPMRELMHFLRRRNESNESEYPVIIPFFYRLSVSELYEEPRLDRVGVDGTSLYGTSRFLERMSAGQPEANIAAIKQALGLVSAIRGVTNDVEASNDKTVLMYYRRDLLLRILCDRILEALPGNAQTAAAEMLEGSREGNVFRASFFIARDTRNLVLDFDGRDESGYPRTPEARLLEMVLDVSETENRVIAITGIGGVGKTSLLHGISCLDSLRKRFYDGIYMLSLGIDASRLRLIRELSSAVAISGGKTEAEKMCSEDKLSEAFLCFRKWFENKTCLFMVSDVWETTTISASVIYELLRLHVSGMRSKVILTARDLDIASLADACFRMRPRTATGNDSRRILMKYAGVKPESDAAEKAVDEILHLCAGLPLFLAIAGRAVKALSLRCGNHSDIAYHRYVSTLRLQKEDFLRTDVDTYPSLSTTLTTVIQFLDEKRESLGFVVRRSFAEMHRRFFVLPAGSIVPMRMLAFLWELENETQAMIIAREFEQMGLAELELVRSESERSESGFTEMLRLHDSVAAFAEMETRKHDEVTVGHKAILRGYGRELVTGERHKEWWHTSLEADGYIHENLCRHLVGAGETTELVDLLLSPQWTARQLRLNGITNLETDFSLGIKFLRNRLEVASDVELSEKEEALTLISEAAVLAWPYVRGNFTELAFQLHGRLKAYGDHYRSIRKYVGCIETDAERPLTLSVNSFLKQAGGAIVEIINVGTSVLCIAVMQGRDKVACGFGDGQIAILDLKRAEVQVLWKAHNDRVNAIAVGAYGRLVSGSADRTAKVWKIENRSCLTVFSGHTNAVNGVAMTGDGKRVISVSDDGTAQVWETETGRVMSEPFTGHEEIFYCVAVVQDGEEVLTGGTDKKLKMWNVAKTVARVGVPFDGHENLVNSVVVTPDGLRIISGSDDGSVRIWDRSSHLQIGESLNGHTDSVHDVAVSKDGRRIASGSSDHTIRVWDTEARTEVSLPLEGHTDAVTGVSFLDSSDCIVSCSTDGTVRMWDVRRRNAERVTNKHRDPARSVSFSPDGSFVVSGSDDQTLRVWESISGQQLGDPLEGHSGCVTDVTIRRDGRFIVSVSADKTVRVWDVDSHELLHKFTGHTDEIRCVAVTPSGDLAITGAADKTVRVWDLKSMDGSHRVLEGHTATVLNVFVTDDASRIISVDEENEIFIWELETMTTVRRSSEQDASTLPRRYLFDLIGEATTQGDAMLSIPLHRNRVLYGKPPNVQTQATLEARVNSWALSPDRRLICVALSDGQVGLLKLLT